MSDALKPLLSGLGPRVTDLQRRAQATVELAEKVRAALPGPQREHVVAANARGETLVVIADSAAWGSHIRYAQQELLERLKSQGETQFTKIRVRVGRKI
jgi:hypothetical protein